MIHIMIKFSKNIYYFKYKMEKLIKDSKFIKELDQDNLDDFFSDEQVVKDLKYIDSLYKYNIELDLESSLHLMNALVKYEFKQLEDFTFLFYYKFGKSLFNKDSFMQVPFTFIENVKYEDIVKELFKRGLLECIRWISEFVKIDPYENYGELLNLACEHGRVNIFVYVFAFYGYIYNENFIINATKSGNLQLVQMLNQAKRFTKEDIKLVIYYSCKYGHLDLLKWIYNEESSLLDDIDLYNACIGGHLKLIKWIYNINKDSLNKLDINCYIKMCSSGFLELVKWLYEIDNNILISNKYTLFLITCEYGHFEFSLWLYSLGIYDLNDGFKKACKNNHPNIAKWIYSIDNNVYTNYNSILLFYSCCIFSSLYIVQWLYSLKEINVKTRNNCFIMACRSGRILIAEWLYSLGGINLNNMKDTIKLMNGRGYYKAVTWLKSLIRNEKI
jgi:hypothetical protein